MVLNYAKLAETRTNLGLSQRKLAEILQVSQDRIYLWESGKHDPSLKHLVGLCHALGLTPNDLLHTL